MREEYFDINVKNAVVRYFWDDGRQGYFIGNIIFLYKPVIIEMRYDNTPYYQESDLSEMS